MDQSKIQSFDSMMAKNCWQLATNYYVINFIRCMLSMLIPLTKEKTSIISWEQQNSLSIIVFLFLKSRSPMMHILNYMLSVFVGQLFQYIHLSDSLSIIQSPMYGYLCQFFQGDSVTLKNLEIKVLKAISLSCNFIVTKTMRLTSVCDMKLCRVYDIWSTYELPNVPNFGQCLVDMVQVQPIMHAAK